MSVRLRAAGLHSALGIDLAAAVEALGVGRTALKPATRFRLPVGEAATVSEIEHAQFLHTLEDIDAILADTIAAALATTSYSRMPPESLLILGASGVLFVGEQMESSMAWFGGAGEVAERLAATLGIKSPPLTIQTACSSSANGLVLAAEAILRDEYPCAIVVGMEGLSPVLLRGFQSLMLLDAGGCRPFDVKRGGFHLGEAVGAILLEPELDEPQGPGCWLLGGAHVCAALGGQGQAPDKNAMQEVMEQALAAAHKSCRDVIAIKAHGLGTIESDAAEAAAIQAVYGTTLPPITSLKRSFGHTLGASGVVETAALMGCLKAGFIPATAGFAHADPALSLTPLTAKLPAKTGCYQLNFFGFGASYVSLVLWFA